MGSLSWGWNRSTVEIWMWPVPWFSTFSRIVLSELSKDNTIRLKVENQGTGHIQISTVDLFHPQDKEPIAEQSGLAYVLPGQSREWNLKLRSPRAKKGDNLRMKVSTDAGSIDAQIDL